MTRVTLVLLAAILLLGFPGTVLADDSYDDLASQLTKDESNYVNSTRARYALIRADLAALRNALAAPSHVTVQEWNSLTKNLQFTQSLLDESGQPPAFAGMGDLNDEIRYAAQGLSEVSAGFDAALGAAAMGASVAGGGHEELGILAMATQLANLNSATEELEGALGTAEAGLELLVVLRVEELEEQEEQVETAKGAGDLFGLSLDPWDYCFIATAAYGTPAAEEIQVLRDFRDGVLLQSPAGRDLVGFYYAASPPVADFIAEHEWLRTVVREGFVDPIVWLVDQTRTLWNPAAAR